jgi:hypothetical protein
LNHIIFVLLVVFMVSRCDGSQTEYQCTVAKDDTSCKAEGRTRQCVHNFEKQCTWKERM